MGKARDKYRLTWKKTHPVSLKVRLLKVDLYIVYVSMKMKISELKDHLELVTGIPYSLQKISYLDAADLLDDTTLAENRILPKTEVDLDVWTIWKDLVKAAIKGDVYEVFRLGVTQDTEFEAPESQYILAMREDVRRDWIAYRAFVALCIGANRGLVPLCKELVAQGVNVKRKTPRGRTALHIAASHGRQEIINLLTDEGIKIQETDKSGWTAINIAILFAKAAAEKQLGSINSKQKYAQSKTTLKGRSKEADVSKRTNESSLESLPKKTSKAESRKLSFQKILTSQQPGTNKEGLKEDIDDINESPKTNMPHVEETSERFSGRVMEGLKKNISGVKKPPRKLSKKHKSKTSPATESIPNIQDIDGLNESSSASILREKSNNLVDTEVAWVNYNDHLEQEDYKEEEGEGGEEEEGGGGGGRRRIGGGGEGKGDKNEEKETSHSKDSLHEYLISLKSEESAVQYPAWAVDAHLKQIESVNNSAKLVLLKLQNHEVGKIS